MIDFKVEVKDTSNAVLRAEERAKQKVIRMTAARVRKSARASIIKRPPGEPSPPGTPPHTHRGQFMRRAIFYRADRDVGVVGPVASIVGDVGNVHEFGGTRGDNQYDERPFMFPALEKQIAGFASAWSGAIT